MQIIPAIDIINGKCVRLSGGDFSKQKIYNDNPLEAAKAFEGAGLQRLHLVDLDGAKSGSIQNLDVLETIAAGTGLQIDFGGGIQSIEDAGNVFNAGAGMICIGSLAVKNPSVLEEWILEFGGHKILVGADTLNNAIKVKGWVEDGGIEIFTFLSKMMAIGLQQIFCTDISKDGMMAGPAFQLYTNILAKFPGIHLIASGGVSKVEDLFQLKEIGCSGAIIGKAIYEGAISLKQLSLINSTI